MRAYLYLMLVAAAVTYLTTPLVRRVARRIGAITPVRDRDVHAVPIPRMGGTAMFLGFAVAIVTASQMSFLKGQFQVEHPHPWAVLIGAGTVCALGIADDVWQLDAVTKIAGQAIAAGLMAWQGVQIVQLPFFGVTIFSPAMLVLLTVFAVLVTINAVNFVDGLDGLAAGVVGIAASAFFVYSYLLTNVQRPEDYSSVASMVTASLVGCCVGFLPHNLNPARIFMGDSGSMLLGLIMASSTIEVTGQVDPNAPGGDIAPAFFPLVLPLAVLALPLIDLGLAVVRRTRQGRMFWQPDKMHLHHRMLNLGHSHASAVLILYVWTATFAFGVAVMAFVPLSYGLLAGVLAVAVSTALTLGPLRRPRSTRRHAQ
ncbi:MAG TPA: MraY family glycosyltransferase [Kineosporiaceae bacterium]|nr:MraY family glycosyltransferase [Kineosporiaceae bacterium]